MVDPLSQENPLFGERRRAVEARCAALQGELERLEAEVAALARRRREVADELRANRNRLLTTLQRRRGRQPAPNGTVQLPPLSAEARFISGRRLRAVCLALLDRFGRLSLTDLHVQLHRHGYAVANRRAVQALADAMGYEHDRGTAARVGRGVYELAAPISREVSLLLAG